jgi:hypothetical protein
MNKPLEKEFKFYLANQDELVKKYNGKFIVIKDESVLNVYDDETKAIEETIKLYPMGTFLVRKCEPGSNGYTQTYHSRVAFA